MTPREGLGTHYMGPNHVMNRRIACPDGTYHRIPNEELRTKDTVCRP